MKISLFGMLIIGLSLSCSQSEEGLIGKWEGKTKRVNSDGELIEANISCVIKSKEGIYRGVVLVVAGANYEFDAIEETNVLVYKDSVLASDPNENSYISGNAELRNDTLLHFDHKVYATKNNALLYSDRVVLDMVRK